MPLRESILLTTGDNTPSVINAAAAVIENETDIDTVSCVVNVPQANWIGWYIKSDTTYSGDLHDFLIYTVSLLHDNGYDAICTPVQFYIPG
jgi:hypothetical protein